MPLSTNSRRWPPRMILCRLRRRLFSKIRELFSRTVTLLKALSHRGGRHARRANSTLDEHVDFGSTLSKIKLKDGATCETFPTSLRELFSYDGMSPLRKKNSSVQPLPEKQIIELLNYYGLQPLTTDIENLNRFLAFIGELTPCLYAG